MTSDFKIGFEIEMVLKNSYIQSLESDYILKRQNGEYSEDKARKAFRSDLKAFLPKKFKDTKLIVVDDGSVATWSKSFACPVELITPPMPAHEAKELLAWIFAFMASKPIETNYTTGLHVNVSYADKKLTRQVLTAALLTELDQKKLLAKYGRLANEYCRPNPRRVETREVLRRIDKTSDAVQIMQDLEESVMYVCEDKYHAVNINHMDSKNQYIEFRMIGNKNYHRKYLSVVRDIDTMLTAVRRSTLPSALGQMPSEEIKPLADKVMRKLRIAAR